MTMSPRVLPVLILAALAAGASLLARGDEQLGKGVSLTEPTPIAALYEAPAKFVGQAIRVDGVVSAVCEAMGCWMALADPKNAELVVRFKVDHGAGIVFPLAARGKSASAEGVFERIAATDAEGREAAAESAGATKGSEFGTTYHVKAIGAVIK